jgi:hypothetical protein
MGLALIRAKRLTPAAEPSRWAFPKMLIVTVLLPSGRYLLQFGESANEVLASS